MKQKTGTKKEETRKRILEAVHRGFRGKGFDGAGVDGLAKDAGVTSGAFYAHMGSKAAAFRQAVVEGLDQFHRGLGHFQDDYEQQWLKEFAKFYMDEKRKMDLPDSCGLQSLSPDVVRADEQTRMLFEEQLRTIAELFKKGLPGNDGEDRVWQSIAMLVGGVTLARAVMDPELADEIAGAVINAPLFADSGEGPEQT